MRVGSIALRGHRRFGVQSICHRSAVPACEPLEFLCRCKRHRPSRRRPRPPPASPQVARSLTSFRLHTLGSLMERAGVREVIPHIRGGTLFPFVKRRPKYSESIRDALSSGLIRPGFAVISENTGKQKTDWSFVSQPEIKSPIFVCDQVLSTQYVFNP